MSNWDDDEEWEEDYAFGWDGLHILNAYAWKAASGQLPRFSVVLGMNIIDAIKSENLDERSAQPYIDVFMRATDGNKHTDPQWD